MTSEENVWWHESQLQESAMSMLFGDMGLMLPLDLTVDLLLFHHQKYQEPENLLLTRIYSSLLGKAAKEDRMKPNASLVLTMHTAWGCHSAAPLMQGEVVTPLTLPGITECTCKQNFMRTAKQTVLPEPIAKDGKHSRGSTRCTCFLSPLP